MTNATIGGRDVAVLYGDAGSDGETVLRYAVAADGDRVRRRRQDDVGRGASGDLRLNYKHTG